MYSREQRQKATELYIKYVKSATKVRRELGYPDRRQLYRWYQGYLEEQKTGNIKNGYKRKPKYSLEQQQIAIDYYLNNGRNMSATIHALGYPSKDTLRQWCSDFLPNRKQTISNAINFSNEDKKNAVIEFELRSGSGQCVADNHKVSRQTLYSWRKEFFSKEGYKRMSNHTDKLIHKDSASLNSEVKDLQKQIKRLQLEKDILEGTVELIKKDPGVNPQSLTNIEKAVLIDAPRSEYPVNELLQSLGITKSSCVYHRRKASLPEKYKELRIMIQDIFKESGGTYGYRRIHASLKNSHYIVS